MLWSFRNLASLHSTPLTGQTRCSLTSDTESITAAMLPAAVSTSGKGPPPCQCLLSRRLGHESQPNRADCRSHSNRANAEHRIRFAAPPTGGLRWQAPRAPPVDRTVVQATSFGPTCPQAFPSVPGVPFILGNEDCLFLNVYAPAEKRAALLPVLVWIHGGGYGLGDGTQDMSTIIDANDNGFVAVSIQYRVSLSP